MTIGDDDFWNVKPGWHIQTAQLEPIRSPCFSPRPAYNEFEFELGELVMVPNNGRYSIMKFILGEHWSRKLGIVIPIEDAYLHNFYGSSSVFVSFPDAKTVVASWTDIAPVDDVRFKPWSELAETYFRIEDTLAAQNNMMRIDYDQTVYSRYTWPLNNDSTCYPIINTWDDQVFTSDSCDNLRFGNTVDNTIWYAANK